MHLIPSRLRAILYLCAIASAAPHTRAQSIAGLQSTIQQRTSHQVEWRKDPATDDQVAQEVHSLLRHPLTVNSAVQIALLNNRDLQATFEKIGIAHADLIEAGLLKNPVFEASARLPNTAPGATDLELSIAQDFLDLLMLPLRKKVAAQELARTQLLVGDAVLKLSTDTKTAVYQLQAATQLMTGIKAISDADSAALQLSTRLHDAGNTSDLDFANQQATYSQSKLDLINLQIEIQSDREKLNRLMSLWGNDLNWTLAADLPPLPAHDPSGQKLESLALSQRLDLAASEAQWTSLVQALGITRTYRYLGAVELGADTENQTDNQRITGPTLRLELPIFNQGQGRIARLQSQLREVERTIESQAIAIRSEVRESSARARAARTLALYYRDDLEPARKQILDLTTTQYNAMLKGGYDLVLAKQNELTARRGYIEALRDYWIARAGLERATGGLSQSLTPVHISPKKPT